MPGFAWSVLLVLATAACAPDTAALPTAAGETAPRDAIVATRTDSAFGDATAALEALIAEAEPKTRSVQHFCVIGYRATTGNARAWVHWQEGNRLILWEPVADPAFARDAIVRSRRSLDLAKDVVANEAAVGGSSYRVTRDWVDTVLADCATKGIRYTIGG